MSKMRLRMEAESGSPQELPEVQDPAGCSQEGVVYKLCKRGHVKSPDNLNKSGFCLKCRREISAKYRDANRVECNKRSSECVKKNPERNRINTLKWRKNHRIELLDSYKKSSKKQRSELSDAYVAHKLGLPVAYCPNDLLEIKRLTIQLHREIRK